jgi:hypothetical protein
VPTIGDRSCAAGSARAVDLGQGEIYEHRQRRRSMNVRGGHAPWSVAVAPARNREKEWVSELRAARTVLGYDGKAVPRRSCADEQHRVPPTQGRRHDRLPGPALAQLALRRRRAARASSSRARAIRSSGVA